MARKLGMRSERTVRNYERGAWRPSEDVHERYRQLRDLHGPAGARAAEDMRAVRRELGLGTEAVRAFEAQERAPSGPVRRLYEAFRDGAED